MTEAAIDAGLFRDLYVAMGEPIGQDGAWAMRLHYKPMVRWMWLGAILMALGGFTTALDKRYRRQRSAVRQTPARHCMAPRLKLFLPLLLFAVMAIFLFRGLSLDPQDMPSALIDRPLPDFSLPVLGQERLIRERI